MERKLPPTFRELLVVRHVYRPGFWARLKLAIGFNVLIELRIATEHRTGRCDKRIKVEPTLLVTSPITTQEDIDKMTARPEIVTRCEPQTNKTENI